MPATPTTLLPAARAAANGNQNTPEPETTTAPTANRNGLTTRQRVLTALAGRPDGVTVAELATITGLAIRTPGGRTGNRRAPDTWTPPTTTTTPPATAESTTAEPTTAPAEAAA